MTSAPAIGFEYRPSRLLRRVLVFVAVLAVCAVMLSALSPWLKGALMLATSVLTWQSLRRLAEEPVTAAGWSADGGWTLRLTDHDDLPATLVSFRVLGVFVLLRLSTEQGTRVLLLAPDNSDADIHRRLRMRLAILQPDRALPNQ